MPVGRVHLAQGRGDDLDVRKLPHALFDDRDEGGRIEFGLGFDVLALDAEALLQILLVADEHIDVADDAAEHVEPPQMSQSFWR